MRNLPILLWFSIIFLIPLAPAHAKLFQNSYVQFELPDRWDCKLEGTEYVCSPLQANQAKEVIFVLTAKEVGPSDTLEAYEAHLKTPKVVPSASGKPSTSTVKNVDKRQYNGHTWMDSMHLGSEIPAYYTRYLATTKDRLAILVTFSAHQLHFTKYSADILKAVQTLVVKANFSLKHSDGGSGGGFGGGGVIGPQVPGAGGDLIEDYPTEPKSKSNGKSIALFLLIAAACAYLFIQKRRKKSN